ncbi:MAG: TIGR04283 family arsenosugar biosynthesis glycosyltransferase [Eubacteriales bacterium]
MTRKTKEAIIVFTRIPEPGKTKTRLMPCYTALECAKLHAYFVKDTIRECEKLGIDIFVYYEPQGRVSILKKIIGHANDCAYAIQVGESLGERMQNAMDDVLGCGYEKCVLIGTDIPELQAKHLKKAFSILDTTDVVLGPTWDGGYYLIGSKKSIPEAFQEVEYGTENVAVETKEGLEKYGYTVNFADVLLDIDTPEDLLEYGKMELENSTGNYLEHRPKISVIIPIYNEASTIMQIQKEVQKLKDCEIIFVDGGSADDTCSMIDEKYRVILSEKGRANQMNAGALASGGNILFFLHSDSELPEHPENEIRAVMRTHNWGCFGIAYHTYTMELLVCRLVSNHRIKDRKVVFGDQGIFIDRELFFRIGMYPRIPIMEDYQLSLTLKEKKERIGITKHRIITSPRRFEGGFVNRLRIMWQMNRLRAMYRQGVDIERIARLYKDIR